VEIDDSDERMQKKIRTASKQKVPFVLLAGATDAEAGAVSFRYRDGSQRNGVPVDDAVQQIADWGRRPAQPRPDGRGPDRLPGQQRDPGGRMSTSNDDGGPASVFEHLWTPYRMAYIRGENKPTGDHDCPFCLIPKMSDEDGLIVARGTTVFAVLNLYPYNAGHLMLVPYRHVPDYTDLTSDEVAELGAYTQAAMRVVRSVSGAHGSTSA
jgi:hypothetical protein